jgi:uncharacterized SAM-dependent methyltransferase
MQSRMPYNQYQLSEIVKSLQENHISPLKFTYFAGGASRFMAVNSHPKYGIPQIETRLLRNKIINVFQDMAKPSTLNVLDIGCGDGRKAKEVLSCLTQWSIVKYLPIDISAGMLTNAIRTVRGNDQLGSIEIQDIESDFEEIDEIKSNQIRKHKKYQNSLLLFLGNILGNVQSPEKVLNGVIKLMDPGDHMLVGIDLWNQDKIQEIRQQYEFREMFDLVFTTLEYLGAKQGDGEFDVLVDQDDHEVKIMFKFNRVWEYTLPFQIHYRTITAHFEKGDSVQLASSYRFSKRKLAEIMRNIHLPDSQTYEDDAGTFLLINFIK